MAFVSPIALSLTRTSAPTCRPMFKSAAVVRIRPSKSLEPMSMSMESVASDVAVKASQSVCYLASTEKDFGGYTGPVLGLLVIGVIIAFLTPAVKE